MEYQGFLFVNSIQYSCAVFSVNLCAQTAVTREPWIEFLRRLSCAWMGKYIQKYKNTRLGK